jgi:ankyrin repeat protein
VDERLKSAITAGDERTVHQLLEREPALARERENGLSAVLLAAYYKQAGVAEALLEVRGPADLFEASALGMDERVHELVGWDPRAVLSRSADGFTALHLAAYFAHPSAVRLLLEHDADVEDVADNATRVRQLHSGVAGRNVDVVEALLSAGAELEARQQDGFTPLMGAAAGGATDIVERLVAAGAEKHARNDAGKTALDIARERGHAHLEELLGG